MSKKYLGNLQTEFTVGDKEFILNEEEQADLRILLFSEEEEMKKNEDVLVLQQKIIELERNLQLSEEEVSDIRHKAQWIGYVDFIETIAMHDDKITIEELLKTEETNKYIYEIAKLTNKGELLAWIDKNFKKQKVS